MFRIGDFKVGLESDLFLMAGPCVLEDMDTCRAIAEELVKVRENTGIGVIYKGSFDKANRSSIDSFRGPGLEKGMEVLAAIRDEFGFAVMTDVHEPWQAEQIAKTVDCMQVPAFLCRQTDLLMACAKTGKPTAVKKGQFVSPGEMKNVVGKLRASGLDDIMLTERGTFFGYNRLVNDMTAIEQMKQLGAPVIFDATHSTQQPGGLGSASAGRREMAPLLARSAVAAGANGLFLEVHTDPENAKCDAACIMPVGWVEKLIRECQAIAEVIRN
ncbi:2-dehydro-3-deoxyphosphooctonate aldolase [Anaerohalosphaera lusitana]|uniref:3-deoxy-8-phosphooctulonate synthase n=1 Tax=Anaerohalosphaera lusitana TaxID=1936003 RepID=A0A1U9NK50_9BACT|nr:3-deoxy-8-phosphooctulonate synthase [Anaerohalosphaera lusitana]AQT68302.1 2-dehydro-3-deoxyphosphooctonate aldolase [Anaerohalosphaera lusitana]